MECVARHLDMHEVIKSPPGTSRKNFYVSPWQLDFAEDAKFGPGGRFPSNCQFLAHFPSVIQFGFQSEREALEVKFTKVPPTSKQIPAFSIGYVDGQNKALMIQSALALLQFAAAWTRSRFMSGWCEGWFEG